MGEENDRSDEYQVTGDDLVAKVKELMHEGHIRRVTIQKEEGRELIEIPFTWGVVGASLLPVLAAMGAIAVLATDCTIVVEKIKEWERAGACSPQLLRSDCASSCSKRDD